jgi:hypothetical protein
MHESNEEILCGSFIEDEHFGFNVEDFQHWIESNKNNPAFQVSMMKK